jgi:phosphotransferase system enzyme I (PtsI)
MTDSVDLTGIPASSGIGIAPAFVLENPDYIIDRAGGHDASIQFKRFREAQDTVKKQINDLKKKADGRADKWSVKIFDSHLFLIGDPELESSVESRLTETGVTAECALLMGREELAAMLENSGSDLIAERADDIRDVTDRMISILTGRKQANLSLLPGEVVLIAHDLSPLETAQLDTSQIKAIVTETGGRSGHTAIMARSCGIPAVTGVKGAVGFAENGLSVIVDGGEGRVVINPAAEELESAQRILAEQIEEKERLNAFIDKKTLTRDGVRITLGSHLGRLEELDAAISYGAEGIGLFRTEFLFMDRTAFPDEDEQFEVYREVLERMNPKQVVVRTMDIGGDKKLPYADLPLEDNPFLGLRGIRYSLKYPEVFRVQLRALLRAAQYGNLKILLPMVSSAEEVVKARGLLDEEIKRLSAEGIPIPETLQFGVMIEVPSAALIADELADLADFFSIGTNDLIQYTMAADRTNQEVSHLYQPLHPAVLRLIKMVTEAAGRKSLRTGVCGEMAGDLEAVPVLLNLGVTELSLSAPLIPAVRELISEIEIKE